MKRLFDFLLALILIIIFFPLLVDLAKSVPVKAHEHQPVVPIAQPKPETSQSAKPTLDRLLQDTAYPFWSAIIEAQTTFLQDLLQFFCGPQPRFYRISNNLLLCPGYRTPINWISKMAM